MPNTAQQYIQQPMNFHDLEGIKTIREYLDLRIRTMELEKSAQTNNTDDLVPDQESNLILDESSLDRLTTDKSAVKLPNGLEYPKIDPLSDLENTKIKEITCRDFMEFLIVHNGGGVQIKSFLNCLQLWARNPNSSEDIFKFNERTVRSWVSQWKERGRLERPETGLYSITKETKNHAMQQNKYLKGSK